MKLWSLTGAIALLLLAAVFVLASGISRDGRNPEAAEKRPPRRLVTVLMILGGGATALLLVTGVLAVLGI